MDTRSGLTNADKLEVVYSGVLIKTYCFTLISINYVFGLGIRMWLQEEDRSQYKSKDRAHQKTCLIPCQERLHQCDHAIGHFLDNGRFLSSVKKKQTKAARSWLKCICEVKIPKGDMFPGLMR